MRRVPVSGARDAVLEAARRVAEGGVTPEIESLRLRLERATGVEIAELAGYAEDWLDNV
jgi:hypothetical protein